MRGLVTIDNQLGSLVKAMWVTSISSGKAIHANAVVVDYEADDLAEAKVRSLTRHSGVVLTDGSVADGLPVEYPPMTLSEFEGVKRLIDERREAILRAIEVYRDANGARARSAQFPDFKRLPDRGAYELLGPTPSAAAFATANYLAAIWNEWLLTEEERTRRTVQPRTLVTPWIMPAELNSPAAQPIQELLGLKVEGLV